MKKILFTLAALFITATAFADSGFCFPSVISISENQLGTEIELALGAHFDARVSGVEVLITFPEGMTATWAERGDDMTIQYYNSRGRQSTYEMGITGLNEPYDHWLALSTYTVGYWQDPESEDPTQWVSYGVVKWEAGDYDDMMRYNIHVDEDFTGGKIIVQTSVASGKDTRGGTVRENGQHGQSFTFESYVVLESDAIFEVNNIRYYATSETTASVISNIINNYSGNVIIPASVTHNGHNYSVTSIHNRAFSCCSGLTSVTIPNSVTTIGSSAFSNCSSLASVNIPNSVTTISDNLFSGCSSLANVNIPNSVTSIGNSAFQGCRSLVSLTIPNSVTSIGSSAFSNCSGLTSVTIPNSVTTISDNLYSGCSSLTSVNIPNSVTSIGNSAFQGCSSLASVTIPNSVTSIGNRAFSDCSAIDILYFNAVSCADFSSTTNEQPFNNSNISIINISDSVQQIPAYFAHGLANLTSVRIGKSVTAISNNAFSGCSGLTTLEWDAINCTTNGNMSTNNIETVSIGEGVTVLPNSFVANSKITEVLIPSTISSIGTSAFYGCTGLTSVTIPNSVTTISDNLCSGCSSLASVNIPNSVTSIGNSAFKGCRSLTNISIPNSVTDIGSSAFSGCSGLINLNIPNTITDISSYSFQGCSGLTSINIPNSVTNIGASAFQGCSGLTSINIPNSVTNIGASAFQDCSGLVSVFLPDSIPSIGNSAFYRCPNISKVTLMNPAPPTCGNLTTFNNNVYNHANLYVPKETIASYKASENWGQFIHIIGVKTSNDIFAESIKLNHRVVNLGVGSTTKLLATVLPDSTTNRIVTWMTDNEDVATVDSAGVVTAVAVGNATITATTTDGTDLSASCTIQVYEDISQFDNYLNLSDTTVMHGETVVIPVTMVNDASIVSFQTDIFLPEGVEIVQEDGEYVIDPSERMTRTHSIMSSDALNGAVRMLCYSTNYKPFTGNSGDVLFYITVKIADDADGDYPIALCNTLMTTSDFDELTIPDVAANVNVLPYLLGDANNSGSLTITDVVTTAQYVLDKDPQPFVFDAADVNYDGNITVTDVTRIAWMLLNENAAQAPLHAPALRNIDDRLSGEGVCLQPGETRTVSIALNNEMDYSAFQLDLTLPDGLTASNFALTDRANGHTLDVNTLSNGKTRVLCYSLGVTAIIGHEGALLTFDVTASGPISSDITVDGIELVTTACQTVLPNAFTIGVNTVTAADELAAGKTVAHVDYYNVAGQHLAQPANGVTIIVTTYTDGTRTTTKVIK